MPYIDTGLTSYTPTAAQVACSAKEYRSSLAEWSGTSEATQLGVVYEVTLAVAICQGAVLRDGVLVGSVGSASVGTYGTVMSLAGGSQTITLRDGGRSITGQLPPDGASTGTRIVRVYSYSALTIATPSIPTRRLYWIGDSISCGWSAANMATEGMAVLVRADYPGSVTVDALASGGIHDRFATAARRTEMAGYIAAGLDGTVTNELLVAIGTNDWPVLAGGASVFESALGDLLDKVHALSAATPVWILSPLPRTNPAEATVYEGSTLPDYRTACGAVAAARSGWCTHIDGSTLNGTLAGDGVHPTTAGHATNKGVLKTALGY